MPRRRLPGGLLRQVALGAQHLLFVLFDVLQTQLADRLFDVLRHARLDARNDRPRPRRRLAQPPEAVPDGAHPGGRHHEDHEGHQEARPPPRGGGGAIWCGWCATAGLVRPCCGRRTGHEDRTDQEIGDEARGHQCQETLGVRPEEVGRLDQGQVLVLRVADEEPRQPRQEPPADKLQRHPDHRRQDRQRHARRLVDPPHAPGKHRPIQPHIEKKGHGPHLADRPDPGHVEAEEDGAAEPRRQEDPPARPGPHRHQDERHEGHVSHPRDLERRKGQRQEDRRHQGHAKRREGRPDAGVSAAGRSGPKRRPFTTILRPRAVLRLAVGLAIVLIAARHHHPQGARKPEHCRVAEWGCQGCGEAK